MQKITRNNHSFNVNPEGYERFWELFQSEKWEPETTKIFDVYINTNTTYLDIGAWIGPTLFYAANLADKCFAVEADPIAYERLTENLKANEDQNWFSEVTLINKAVSDEPGTIQFGSQKQGGDSMSSILWGELETSWRVKTISVKDLLSKITPASNNLFIKIDIEGSEFTMLGSLNDIFSLDNAIIFISLHNIFLKRSLEFKYKNLNYLQRFFKVRTEFTSIYRELFRFLPKNKICTINGRTLSQSSLIFIYIWLFCKPPNEKKFRDLLMIPKDLFYSKELSS